MMKASVVILSWNSTEVLGPCLASLPQGFTSQDYEVIIIDNGSRGLTPAAQHVMPVLVAKGEEMNRLVEQMVESARLEEGQVQLARAAQLVRSEVEEL